MTPKELLQACGERWPTGPFWDQRHRLSLSSEGDMLLCINTPEQWIDLKFDDADWGRPIEDIMKEVEQIVEENRKRLASQSLEKSNEPERP